MVNKGEQQKLCEDANKNEMAQRSYKGEKSLLRSDLSKKKFAYAFIFMVSSMCVGSVSLVCAQVLDGSVPRFQMSMLRNAFNFVVLIPFIDFQKTILVKKNDILLLAFIVMIINVGQITYYVSTSYVALGTMGGITYSLSITGNAILSIWIKSERSISLYISSLLACLGLILMAQPEFIFHNKYGIVQTNWTAPCIILNKTFVAEKHVVTSNIPVLGFVFMVITAAVICSESHSIKHILNNVSPTTVLFWINAIGVICNGILMSIFENPYFPLSIVCISLIGGHLAGAFFVMAAFPLTLQYLSPTVSTMLYSVQLVLLIVAQHTLLKNISPGFGNTTEIIGGAICFIAAIIGPMYHTFMK